MSLENNIWDLPERAQSTENGDMRRREALKLLLAGSTAAVSGLFRTEKTEAAALDDQMNKHTEALNNLGYLTLKYNPAMEGKGLLAPSIVTPNELRLQPVRIAKPITTRNGFKGAYWLPNPQHLGPCRNIAQKAGVIADGKEVDPKDYEASVMYSNTDKNPHLNSMTMFNGTIKGKEIIFYTDTWMILPEYGDAAGSMNPAVQQGVQNLARTMSPRELAGLKQYQQSMMAGLSAASSLRWDGSQNDLGIRCADDGVVDCGGKAVTAKRQSGKALEIVIGFDRYPDSQYNQDGGQHAVNYGSYGFNVDPGSNGNIQFSPTGARHIATEIGEYRDYPEKLFPFNKKMLGTNNGAYRGSGVRRDHTISFSTDRGGLHMNDMQQLTPEQEIEEYAQFHIDQIKRYS